MKIINSLPISSFGGINFVFEELDNLKIDNILNHLLPDLPSQCKYSWKDIIYSYWSILLCGGDCAEDISINLKLGLVNNPYIKLPSPDRLLDRLKDLSVPSVHYKKYRAKVFNEFSTNQKLNILNLKILKRLSALKFKEAVLDYDNTYLFTDKADAQNTYLKAYGYCPGVGIIGNSVVYVENRNGNCAPHTLQEETIERMFDVLDSQGIEVDVFRADSASFQFNVITTVNKYVKKFYIKARINEVVADAINNISQWDEVCVGEKVMYRGSINFTPFKSAAEKNKQEELLKEYRLVVTKEAKKDGQMDLFTREACIYSAILTNEFDKSDDEVVLFYNQRGKQEREFDILKNDFAWNRMPFSKLEYNTVYLIITAICRNIYNYIISKFSKTFKNLAPYFRLKKFIFRFICIPAKWIRSGRVNKLIIYRNIAFKT
jgi:hypothetical protein